MTHLNWGSNYAFWAYSLKHAAVLAALGTAAIAIVAVGRSVRDATRLKLERLAAIVLAGVWAAGLIFDLLDRHGDSSTQLPLHWCDLCGLLTPIVMFAPQYRLPRAILHFWSICLCSFAFAMPVIGLGPVFLDFWIYFGTHAAIVLTAVYDRSVRGFSPNRRDLNWACGLAAAWTIILQPINLALHANYGFVGADDHHVRKAIRALGPWPWRLAPMLILEWAMMTTLMLAQYAVVAGFAQLMVLTRRPNAFGPASLPMPTAMPEPAAQLPRAA